MFRPKGFILVAAAFSMSQLAVVVSFPEWSPVLSEIGEEKYPLLSCSDFNTTSDCQDDHFCCFTNGVCSPTNPSGLECPLQVSKQTCEEPELNCIWKDGSCKRVCPSLLHHDNGTSYCQSRFLIESLPQTTKTRFPSIRTNFPTKFPTTLFPSKRPVSVFPSKSPSRTEYPSRFPSKGINGAESTKSPISKPSASPTMQLPWVPGLYTEQNPDSACSSFHVKSTCELKNFCCWSEEYKTCSFPSLVPDLDCPLITEKDSCFFAFGSDVCQWQTGLGCVRVLPPMESTLYCPYIAEEHQQRLMEKRVLFPSAITTPISTSGLNARNQYCWIKPLKQACHFPFMRNNQTFSSCFVDNSGKALCETAEQVLGPCTCTSLQKRKRSVLLVILDDFRPEMNAAYGRRNARTPVFDDFATRPGTIAFSHVYAQFSVCSPSRDSFLSGLYPDTTKSYSFWGQGIGTHPNRTLIKTLPQLFKDAGFWTSGGGKIFHEGRNDLASWHEYFLESELQNAACLQDPNAQRAKLLDGSSTQLACTTSDPQALLDHRLTERALVQLDKIVHSEQEPFFLALGFYKPHTPYHVHKMFSSKQDDDIQDDEPSHACEPRQTYNEALTFDMSDNHLKKNWGGNPFAETKSKSERYFQRLMQRGYQSAVAQSDYFIGQVLNKLESLALRQSTLVIMVGDHGYSLGENNVFAKNTNFEIATRVPLLFHVPWLSLAASKMTIETSVRRLNDFVELVDLLPTVARLMGVAFPPYFQGKDQSTQVLANLMGKTLSPRRQMAFSQIVRCPLVDCSFAPFELFNVVGYTVRTREWRYTVYLTLENGRALWNEKLGQELYENQDDKTILAFETGANYGGMNEVNVFKGFPEQCEVMFRWIQDHFEHSALF